jgi:hypothetical protein
MTIHTRPKQTLSKSALTKYRQDFVPDWQKTERFRMLEQKYGSYLYLPLDTPPIVANDTEAFKQWFLEKSKPTIKRMADIANPDQVDSYALPSFLAIDSKNILDIWKTKTWDVNPVSDMYEAFPEIKEKIDQYMPFKKLEYYTLWSSLWPVSPHRDEHPLCDMPFAFRINLYDENPEGTLKLHKGLPDLKFADCESKVIEHFESNAFAWNNLRTLHSSTKNSKYMKILMIVSPTYKNVPDLDKLEALFDASIEKYKDGLWQDTNVLGDYINVGT